MKNVIELATKGGWSLDLSQVDHYDEVPCDKGFLLDPLFWQALGKSLGWREHGSSYDLDHFGGKPQWEYEWHNFIDHLIAGGNPEEFFTRLLAEKR